VVTNKKEIFDHVFKTLEIPEEVQDFFKSTWQIKSVGMLINIDQEKMMDQDEIVYGHVAAIALFIEWLKQYITDHEGKTPLNWEFEFTEDIWEDYILHRGASKGGGIVLLLKKAVMQVVRRLQMKLQVKEQVLRK